MTAVHIPAPRPGIDEIAKMPGFEEAGFDTPQAVLERNARKFNECVVGAAELSDWRPQPVQLGKDGVVTTTPGLQAGASSQYGEGGWQGLQHPLDCRRPGSAQDHRRGLREMINAANLSFALCPAAHRRRHRGAAHRPAPTS
jgi:hypothetical protein